MVAITPTPRQWWCSYTQKEIGVSYRSKRIWSACGVSLWDRSLSKVGAYDEKILRWIFVDLLFNIYVEIAPGWASVMLHTAQNNKSHQPLPPNVFKLKRPKSQREYYFWWATCTAGEGALPGFCEIHKYMPGATQVCLSESCFSQ